MKRKLKDILKRKLTLIICLSILFLFIFMSNAYSILKTKIDITGNASIDLAEESWMPKLSFVKISQIENMFFYEITITNDSDSTFYDWKIKIDNTGYIFFPFGIDAVENNDGWILKNTIWDNRIDAGGKLVINITFMVTGSPENSMTQEEYADYFVRNHIKISSDVNKELERDGKIITNGKATLTLSEKEEEITDFTLEVKKDYVPSTENEKQYILTIYNNTNYDYTNVRVNVYLGNGVLINLSPSEIICQHKEDVTFKIPIDIILEREKAVSVYITINSKDSNFVPKAVIAGEIY